jgi:predicted transcriptional regulator
MSKAGFERHDVAIGRKALLIAPGLSAADMRVGGAILDHFNKRTGQCDPSIARLAALLGIDEKTVRRATNELCAQGLFQKSSHGGKSFRAEYRPQWSKFREIIGDWDRRMRCIDDPERGDENRAEMPADPGRKCPVTPGENVRQTHVSNPCNKPISLPDTSKLGSEQAETLHPEQPLHGLGRRVEAAPDRINYEARERAATAGSSRHGAAFSTASERVHAAIIGMPDRGAEVWTWLDESTLNAAIREEMRRRGNGLAFIANGMRQARLNWHAEAANARTH